MRIAEIDSKTEGTFFRCLHDERPDDPRVVGIRRSWYDRFKPKGLRGKALIADNDDVVGLCQYLPIDYSPFDGKDLMAILCMWIHGFEHHIGNQQRQGYGRFFLEHVEEDAKESGMKGVAVWGKDFPYWNPVSFYEHMGYSRADKEGQNVLVWKAFDTSAKNPTIKRRQSPKPGNSGKVTVTTYLCGWCCSEIKECLEVQEAVEGIKDIAEYSQIDISSCPSISGIIYFDDILYRPDGPPATIEELKNDITKFHEIKKRKKHNKLNTGDA